MKSISEKLTKVWITWVFFKNILWACKTLQEPFKIWLLQWLNGKASHPRNQRCLTFCVIARQPMNTQEKWEQICNLDIIAHMIIELHLYFWVILMPKFLRESWKAILQNRPCLTFELPERALIIWVLGGTHRSIWFNSVLWAILWPYHSKWPVFSGLVGHKEQMSSSSAPLSSSSAP